MDREPVLEVIDSWTGDLHGAPRVAVLSGMAGVGKSTTARRWAHRDATRFPGGAFYVDFAELRREAGEDISAGVSQCLRALGVEDRYLPRSLGELSAGPAPGA
ncbi:hypothetical protein [Streptomyces sp. NPDC014733]|uniref:hypothetical protein n=1 Tax=Streptomyces sp. NPDC014733 TaxID=3364885 RepID=UPI0036FAED87